MKPKIKHRGIVNTGLEKSLNESAGDGLPVREVRDCEVTGVPDYGMSEKELQEYLDSEIEYVTAGLDIEEKWGESGINGNDERGNLDDYEENAAEEDDEPEGIDRGIKSNIYSGASSARRWVAAVRLGLVIVGLGLVGLLGFTMQNWIEPASANVGYSDTPKPTVSMVPVDIEVPKPTPGKAGVLKCNNSESSEDTSSEEGGTLVEASLTVEPTATLLHGEKDDRVPVSIEFIGKDIECDIWGVGLDSSGNMEVVDSVSVAGWLKESAVPGEDGNSIIAGHIAYKKVKGRFSVLKELVIGDTVLIEFDKGNPVEFTVENVDVSHLDELPKDALTIGVELGYSKLTLITCYGDYNRDIGTSEHRVIVTCYPSSKL